VTWSISTAAKDTLDSVLAAICIGFGAPAVAQIVLGPALGPPLVATKNQLGAIGDSVIELFVTWTTSTAAKDTLDSLLAAICVGFGAPVVAQ
jgi:uncharacterized protein (DUF849 family)